MRGRQRLHGLSGEHGAHGFYGAGNHDRNIEAGGATFAPGAGKLDSGSSPVLRLRPTPKLVDQLRARSRNPAVRVVAFKLTRGEDPIAVTGAVDALFAHSGAEIVVHNDLAERAGPEAFPATIHRADGEPAARVATRSALAEALAGLLAASPPA